MPEEFKGARIFLNIPVFAARDKDLLKKPKSLLLLGEVVSMLNITGKFFMSNKKLAERLDCTPQAINNYLRLLEEKKLIVREKVYSKDNNAIIGRTITAGPTLINARLLGVPNSVGEGSKRPLGRVINARLHKENSLKEQNKRSNNGQERPDGNAPIREQIIIYLNKKLDAHYKPNASKNKQVINARLNEGYTLDDFKRAIDNKIADWGNDKKMSKFLRPETLFGPKMDGYVNEKVKTATSSFDEDSFFNDHSDPLKDVDVGDLPF